MRLSSTLSNCVLKTSSDVPRAAVPVTDCSQCKKIFLFYTEMKPFPVQLVPVTPCLLHVAPVKRGTPSSL